MFWNFHRYGLVTVFSNEADGEIPCSFVSCMATCKEKFILHLDAAYKFIVLHDQPVSGGQILLVPVKFRYLPSSKLLDSAGEENLSTNPVNNIELENEFLSTVHVALKLL